MDDIWLTYHNLEFAKGLPYRDFWPYKTVLGYYIFLWPLLIFKHDFMVYQAMKFWLLSINIVCLAIASHWMTKFYPKNAVLVSLCLIVFSHVFLQSSIEIRVDLLAFWSCLFSMLAIMDKRFWLAGIFLGLGFMICQKVLWYWVATNLSLLLSARLHSRKDFMHHFLSYNLVFFMIVLAYFVFWGIVSSFHRVFQSMVMEPYVLNAVDWYIEKNLLNGLARWQIAVWHFYKEIIWLLIFPVVVILILLRSKPKFGFELICASVIILFLLSSKQPFDYLYLAALPALLLLFAKAFSMIDLKSIGGLNSWEKYSLICILGYFILVNAERIYFQMTDNDYQRYNYQLLERLITNRGDYIAGAPFLLNKPQAISGLSHLTSPSTDYINHPSPKLYPVMLLKSLYFLPISIDEVMQEIDQKKVLLYLDNGRFQQLSEKFKIFLKQRYQHYWGSIYLYAPEIEAKDQVISIWFSGRYQINAKAPVYLNHQLYFPNQYLFLTQGQHFSQSSLNYRLVLIPQLEEALDPRFQKNQPKKMLI
jgi:hypothetical protein